MRRPRRIPPPIVRASALLMVACLVAAPVQAQFGALRRAVERKVEDKANENVADRTNVGMLRDPTFDGTTVELTDALLDRYLTVLEGNRTQRAARQAEARAVRARAQAIADSASALDDPGGRRAYEDATERFDACRDKIADALQAEADKRFEAVRRRMETNPITAMNDPQLRKLVELQTTMQGAAARGDTVGERKAFTELRELMGMPDSASLDKRAAPTCGARPAVPAWIARQKRMTERSDSLRSVADAMGMNAARPTGKELGISETAAAAMDERIISWLSGMRPDAPVTVRFTRAEYDRLLARRDKLRKARYG
jgi:hypothetical protein